MPIDPEQAWTDEFANLKPATGTEWAIAFADAMDKHATNKAQLTGITGQVLFTFNKALFATQLLALQPSPDAVSAMAQFANAWATAVTASTMVVLPGSSFGVPAPPTLWSVVFSSLIDAPSIAAAKSFLTATLPALPPAKDAKQSKIGPTYRQAFLMLTTSVTGLNSVPTPAGPLPLAAPLVPFM